VAITNSDTNSNRVYQMHLQLFPLSKELGTISAPEEEK